MKIILLITSLFLIISCKKQLEIGEDLTKYQKQFLIQTDSSYISVIENIEDIDTIPEKFSDLTYKRCLNYEKIRRIKYIEFNKRIMNSKDFKWNLDLRIRGYVKRKSLSFLDSLPNSYKMIIYKNHNINLFHSNSEFRKWNDLNINIIYFWIMIDDINRKWLRTCRKIDNRVFELYELKNKNILYDYR